MKKIVIVSLICLAAGLYIFNTIRNNDNKNIIEVSVVQLISNPTDYDGKKVRIIGVGNIAFEGSAIYQNSADWEVAQEIQPFIITSESISIPYEKSIWIEESDKTTASFNGKFVIVEGVFDRNNHGHFCMWQGAVVDITRYDLLKP